MPGEVSFMKLFVAVLCYRVPDLTIDCLRSLSKEIERTPETKVGVCENGTGGDAPERLARAIEENGWSSWCDLTVVYPNRGFTGGNNLLIRPILQSANPPEYVLLLNADTIVQERALEALVQFMDRCPGAGIAGSQLLSPGGEVQASPFRFPTALTELDRGLRLGILSKLIAPQIVPPKTACAVDWVAGASMILRKTMLDEIGLLDEGLYTYYDDIDMCIRSVRAGWTTWFVPDSKIVHLEGASTGVTGGANQRLKKRRPAYWFEARRRFFLKNYGSLHTGIVDAAFLSGYALWCLRRLARRIPDLDPPHMLADSFRHSVFCSGFELSNVENPLLRDVPVTEVSEQERDELSPPACAIT
jgi:N-acetylglucosaminyl-diphospho-decaprenol L-rhamnosyltransferase